VKLLSRKLIHVIADFGAIDRHKITILNEIIYYMF